VKRILYNKLVRDKIPQIIDSSGRKALCETLSQKEVIRALDDKLKEEVAEYLEDHQVEELADIMEVIHGILHARGIGWNTLESIREAKRRERGGFDQGVFLKEVVEP